MRVADGAALAALLGSAGLLTAALLFEHLGGLSPCPLCQWQRAGHLLALLGALSLFGPSPVRRLPGLFGSSGSAMVGGLQLGMERGWWSGPSGCGGAPDLAGLSAAETLERMLLTVPVPCDAVTWSLLGLSMAGWNALLSALIAGLWSLSTIRKNMRIRFSDHRLAPRT